MSGRSGVIDHKQERVAGYHAHIARLEAELLDLDRAWHKIPRLLWASFFALPVGAVWGLALAALVLFFVVTATGMAFYFYAVRRSEWRHMIADTQADLKRFLEH